MAPKNLSCPALKSSKHVKPFGSSLTIGGLDLHEVFIESQRFDWFSWKLVMTPGKLESLKSNFKVPDIIEFEVLSLNEGAIDYASNVALYHSMFSSGLKLHFYRPVWDVLDYLHLAPT